MKPNSSSEPHPAVIRPGFPEHGRGPVRDIRRRLPMRILPLAICVLFSLPACRQKTEQANVPSWTRKSGKTLLMHYMPWYETPEVRGAWGSHWTGHAKEHDPSLIDEQGLPDIWSHYHPLIGLYDSTDPDVLECQLLQMKIAGVDGVIVDWYGIGKAADYPAIHDATREMFSAAGTNGMKFSVCYEDRSIGYMEELRILKPEESGAHLTDTFRWMQEEWFREPQYVRLGGRPLVLNFGPMHVKDPAVWSSALGSVPDRPALYGLHHLWKQAGADGGFMWVNQSVWNGSPDEEAIRERLQKEYDHASDDTAKLIVSAYPGFRDVYEDPHPVLDHRNGATMKESLRACMAGPWDIVQLVTWNDYGEGTMIEPTREFGYTFLEVIQEERRAEQGEDFPYRKDDLRLPAMLLALRRNASVAAGTCDQIAELIRGGDCAAARKLINAHNNQQTAGS